jgi:hypothetical protein
MHLFKEENVQTNYPKKKPTTPASQYILPVALLAIVLLFASSLLSMALPDPLGEKIQNHMAKFQGRSPTG